MTARHYLAMTDRALVLGINESWRGDMSETGRYLKNIGESGRAEWAKALNAQVVERAANESGEGSR